MKYEVGQRVQAQSAVMEEIAWKDGTITKIDVQRSSIRGWVHIQFDDKKYKNPVLRYLEEIRPLSS